MIRVIGLGAESHAVVVVEIITKSGTVDVTGLLNDDDSIKARMVGGAAVCFGSETLARQVREQGIAHFFMGLNSGGSQRKRRELFQLGIDCGLAPVTVVHPRAIVSASARIGRGGCVLAGALIGAESSLGEDVTVNIGAMIESGCNIQAHTQLGAGCYVGSRVQIGQGAYIGTGAIVQPNVHIGDNVVIAPGAIVSEDVADGQEVARAPQDLPAHNPTRPQPSHAGKGK